MGFMSLFVTSDESVKKETTKEQSTKDDKESAEVFLGGEPNDIQSTPLPNSGVKPIAEDSKDKEKIVSSLMDAMKNSGFKGVGYLDFCLNMKAMESIIQDPETRIRAVLSSLGVRGATLQTILASADFYKTVLDNEELKTAQLIESSTQVLVTAKKEELASKKKILQTKESELQSIKKYIEQITGDISVLTLDVKRAITSIQSNKESFDQAKKEVESKMEDDLKLITSHMEGEIKNGK